MFSRYLNICCGTVGVEVGFEDVQFEEDEPASRGFVIFLARSLINLF